MRILIAENRDFLSKIYASLLEKEGFEVIVEQNGDRALYRMREWKPDLVLLDLKMPDKDGFEVLEERLQDEELQKIPVIVLSALEGDNLPDRVRKLGANEYFHKVELEIGPLMAKIKSLLPKKGEDKKKQSDDMDEAGCGC